MLRCSAFPEQRLEAIIHDPTLLRFCICLLSKKTPCSLPEAASMDPQQRLLLEIVQEGFHAAKARASLTGVYHVLRLIG